MGRPAANITGQTFGRWRVIRHDGQMPDGKPAWLCECACGAKRRITASRLICGRAKACGCQRVKHGFSSRKGDHPVYTTWEAMRARCLNPDERHYKDYGARGIGICERWNDAAKFIEDMLPTWKPGLTLDRYPNNDGNYEPGNCRWATRVEQQNNRRVNLWMEYQGARYTCAQLSRLTGVCQTCLRKWVLRGLNGDAAVEKVRYEKLKRDFRASNRSLDQGDMLGLR